ncbi:MAG: hypothetical protein Q4G59_04850 [Planctomycetia bacterium]|nr:hypothetical protein [Planctomycetia bacterium]
MIHDLNHDGSGLPSDMIDSQDSLAETNQESLAAKQIDLNPYAAPPIHDEKDTGIDATLSLTASGEIDIAALEAQNRKAGIHEGLAAAVIVVSFLVGIFGIPVGLHFLHSFLDYYYLYSMPTWLMVVLFVFGIILVVVIASRFFRCLQLARIKLGRMLGLPDNTRFPDIAQEAAFIIKEAKRLEKERSQISETTDKK